MRQRRSEVTVELRKVSTVLLQWIPQYLIKKGGSLVTKLLTRNKSTFGLSALSFTMCQVIVTN